jgi:ParB-like chromosome segregation protein Spo0J
MNADTHAEAAFKRHAVKWTVKQDVVLADFHLTDGTKQNIRPAGIDDDRVMQYALSMEQGDEFPPVVSFVAKGKRLVLGGCHRIEAAKLAGLKTLDTYDVDLDQQRDERTIEVLQRVLNMYHGGGFGKDERIQHGLRFVALGFSQEDAARMALLKPAMLRSRIDAMKAHARAVEEGVPPPKQEMALVELGRVKQPEFFKGLAELAHSARLTSEQIKAVSQEIRGQNTEANARAVLEKWRDQFIDVIKATAGGKFAAPSSPARRYISYLGQVERRATTAIFDSLTAHERQQAIKVLESVIKKLTRELTALRIKQQNAQRAGGRR